MATSGEPMPIDSYPGWRLAFTDDFDTPAALGTWPTPNGQWSAYPEGWSDTSHHGTYSAARTVSVADSILNARLHTENGVRYVAALQPKVDPQLYGLYAIRMRSTYCAGYKAVPLLWPASGLWPRDGEIDYPEANLSATSAVSGVMHRQDGVGPGDQDIRHTGAHYLFWHTYVTQWAPSGVAFYLDGEQQGARITARVPNTPMRWVIQLETSLDGVIAPATGSADVQVDWVAMWVRA